MSVCIAGPPPGLAADLLDVARLRARARAMLRTVGRSRSELSLSLVDDQEIAELNRRYRNLARPTDVLSFSLLEGEDRKYNGPLLGDVVVSVETAARQARERRRSLDEVVARLVVHGLLHLLGHDHEGDEEARAMRAEERRLWRAIRK